MSSSPIKRAEMYFEAVDGIRKGGALPAGAASQELIAALTRTTYSFRGDRLLLGPKDQVKARLGYSPDDADAFVLPFAQPVAARDRYHDGTMEAAEMRRRWRPGRALTEYDPLEGWYLISGIQPVTLNVFHKGTTFDLFLLRAGPSLLKLLLVPEKPLHSHPCLRFSN